jgi:hypothetical protein
MKWYNWDNEYYSPLGIASYKGTSRVLSIYYFRDTVSIHHTLKIFFTPERETVLPNEEEFFQHARDIFPIIFKQLY